MMIKKKYFWVISSLLITTLVFAFFVFKNLHHERPNIIWFSIDTLRAKSLKAYNYNKETAPRISQMANEGVVFEQVIAQGPVTQVSHFSMLTGTYPFKHTILTTDPTNRLPSNIKIAAEYFKQNGYNTILSGAFANNPPLNLDFGLNRGVDSMIPYDPLLNLDHRKLVFDSLEKMVLSKKPIFAFFHTAMVHGPYLPSSECLEKNNDKYTGKMIWDKDTLLKLFKIFPRPTNWEQDKRTWKLEGLFFYLVDMRRPEDLKQLNWLYDGAIRCMDNELNSFLESLKKIIPSDNTIIILTADHGESMGEHNHLQHGNMSEENLKVPLIIQFPNNKHLRIKTPIRSIDILPSILDYVGIEIPNYIDGKSFLPLLDHPDQKEHFDYAFSQHRNVYAVYHQQFKYLFRRGNEVLYDLSNDPNEQKNLIEEKPEIAYQLESEFFKYSIKKQN